MFGKIFVFSPISLTEKFRLRSSWHASYAQRKKKCFLKSFLGKLTEVSFRITVVIQQSCGLDGDSISDDCCLEYQDVGGWGVLLLV